MNCDRCNREIVFDSEFEESEYKTASNTIINVCKECFEWLLNEAEYRLYKDIWLDDKRIDIREENILAVVTDKTAIQLKQVMEALK